ncbi:hypothetical protein BDDG_12028, partial [Blastomyces dermatitidis ATCC 18188]
MTANIASVTGTGLISLGLEAGNGLVSYYERQKHCEEEVMPISSTLKNLAVNFPTHVKISSMLGTSTLDYLPTRNPALFLTIKKESLVETKTQENKTGERNHKNFRGRASNMLIKSLYP